MKKLKLLHQILVRTKTNHILVSFLIFVFICAYLFTLVEPTFETYSDSLWYCYAVISTTGFGHLSAETAIGQLLSVTLSLYAIGVIAMVTGVLVNYYMEVIKLQEKNAIGEILDNLENLPHLTKEELKVISKRITHLRKK